MIKECADIRHGKMWYEDLDSCPACKALEALSSDNASMPFQDVTGAEAVGIEAYPAPMPDNTLPLASEELSESDQA